MKIHCSVMVNQLLFAKHIIANIPYSKPFFHILYDNEDHKFAKNSRRKPSREIR